MIYAEQNCGHKSPGVNALFSELKAVTSFSWLISQFFIADCCFILIFDSSYLVFHPLLFSLLYFSMCLFLFNLPKTQFLIQECVSLISKPNFISTLCYAIDNPLHYQKVWSSFLYFGAQTLTRTPMYIHSHISVSPYFGRSVHVFFYVSWCSCNHLLVLCQKLASLPFEPKLVTRFRYFGLTFLDVYIQHWTNIFWMFFFCTCSNLMSCSQLK